MLYHILARRAPPSRLPAHRAGGETSLLRPVEGADRPGGEAPWPRSGDSFSQSVPELIAHVALFCDCGTSAELRTHHVELRSTQVDEVAEWPRLYVRH